MTNSVQKNDQVKKQEKTYNIYDRTFLFAVNVANFLKKVRSDSALKIYKNQLIRSSASIGANLAEADGSLTKKDFANKLGIARREARESKHWLKLIRNVSIVGNSALFKEIDTLIQESREILLILSSIVLKAK